jgi:type IV pilus assembly protein PilV
MRLGRHEQGFTLVEILVSMVIIAIGMLGIAKLQAMSYASTGTASYRSLAAIQASSLAAAMRANRNYWTAAPGLGMPATTGMTMTVASGSPNPTANINDGNVTLNATSASATCGTYSGAPLTAYVIAGCDLSYWAYQINKVLPVVNATVTCLPATAINTVTQPIGCTIELNWTENQTGINTQSQSTSTTPLQVSVPSVNGSTTGQTNYTLYVEP